MGIKRGLSNRLLEVGKIKIGAKGPPTKSSKGNTFQPPVKFGHFVITTTRRDTDTGNLIVNKEIMDLITKEAGPEPKEIKIRLPFDDIDMNFFTQFQYYVGKKCACHGDGETATRTGRDGKSNRIECNPDECEFLTDGKCKPSGILSCFLPYTEELGGIFRFRTHSWNSVSGILSALTYISAQTGGILQGLPLKLKMIKKSTADHGNVDAVTIVIDGREMLEISQIAAKLKGERLKLGIDIKRLEAQAASAGFLISKDDPEDVEDEYYHRTRNVTPEPEKGTAPEDITASLREKETPPDPEPEPDTKTDPKPSPGGKEEGDGTELF
jgi:hypothetical protein